MVLTWTEIISHTCSLSRKTNTALTLFQLNSRTTTVWNRQRSWLILRASWIRYTKSRRPFLSKKLEFIQVQNWYMFEKTNARCKNHFHTQGETRPCFIHKTVFLSFFHIQHALIYWQLTTSEKFLIEFQWNDYSSEYKFGYNENRQTKYPIDY